MKGLLSFGKDKQDGEKEEVVPKPLDTETKEDETGKVKDWTGFVPEVVRINYLYFYLTKLKNFLSLITGRSSGPT
jgi:hypothetical protein